MGTAERHAMGIELQLVDLVDRQQWAERQGRTAEVAELQQQIDALHEELAATAESALS